MYISEQEWYRGSLRFHLLFEMKAFFIAVSKRSVPPQAEQRTKRSQVFSEQGCLRVTSPQVSCGLQTGFPESDLFLTKIFTGKGFLK